MLLFVTLFPYFRFEAISKGFNLVALPWVLEQESSKVSVSWSVYISFLPKCENISFLLVSALILLLIEI